MELQRPQVLIGMGSNTCDAKISLVNPSYATNPTIPPLFPGFGSTTELEEWYDFLIKIHRGTTAGGQGEYQDLVYKFHIFELANSPDFSFTIYSVGQSGTGGGGGAAVLTINSQGLTKTLPASLKDVPFFSASNICQMNNWDPSVYGDKMAISIHELDGCTLSTTNGNTTTSTTTTQNTYSSQLSVNFGKKDASQGGILLTGGGTYTTTNTTNISSTYTTNFANDYYIGRILYSYCWSTEGIHEVPFGNLVTLRIHTDNLLPFIYREVYEG